MADILITDLPAVVAVTGSEIVPMDVPNGSGGFTTMRGTTAQIAAIAVGPSGVTPGVYGDAANVPQITVNADGFVTNAQNIPITAGSGTVTSVSVATANGFAGSVANPTTTPALTLRTSVNGIAKGNGTALSAATAGTDYSVGTSALATGILKNTTGTGALSIAAAGTDYQAPITLTTTGSSGAATLVGNTLNIPNYSFVDTGITQLTGDVAAGPGSGSQAATVVRINGTSLAGLSTGILKNTTGTGVPSIAVAGDFPTLNQNTTGSAAKWTTARNLAGNSVDGSANVAFANKFIVQGTTDTGLSGAQFMGALGTGIVKNTTTTGVQSIAVNSDLPAMSATVGGAVPTPPNNTTTFLRGDATWATPPDTGITQITGGVTAGPGNGSQVATVVTNANLTGPITSVGNATSIASQTGTGTTFAMSVSPALTGTPTAPTPSANDDSTKLATTAYVDNSVIGDVGGRLTALTGTAVMTSSVTGATSVYFTPYKGQYVPLWDGAKYVNVFYAAELSQALTDATLSPAAAAASSVYDIYAWNNAGTIVISRGPAWSSSSVRGAAANLTRWKGVEVNGAAITNGPAQLFGTYLGTIATNASATLDYIYGGSASGGTAASLNVWNFFNRVQIATFVFDTGTSYTYTTATIRQARASTGNQVGYVCGLREDGYVAFYQQNVQTAAALSATCLTGMGVNSTTVFAVGNQVVAPTAAAFKGGMTTQWQVSSQIGANVIAALEKGDGTNANSFSVFGGAQLSFSMPM